MKRPRPALIVLSAGLAVLAAVGIGAVAIWPTTGDVAVVTTFGTRHTSPPSAAPVPLAPVAAPSRLEIPAISVDSPVVPVGVDAQKAVEIPDDIFTIGWYRNGVAPGSRSGSAVLVGHRDGRIQGHGALYSLGALRRGDPIAVTTAKGSRLMFRVVSREMISKVHFPQQAPDLFSVSGGPRLTLISCGGYYDRNHGGYQANVVVTAAPV